MIKSAFTLACIIGSASSLRAADARALVGPNILVSRDGDLVHVELMIATSPRNPKHLLGGAITATRPAGGWACKSYASADGGYTWFDASFPEQVEAGGGDPLVAFTADGAALFADLGHVRDEQGRERTVLMVYRSEDGGRTWGKPVVAAPGADHPQIVVDHTGGKHNGRIYIGYLHGYPEYQVSVVRSDDGGRTFGKPVLAASGKGIIGINVTSVHLLSDGTLVVPYVDFDFHQQPKPPIEHSSGVWMVTSPDGGETFSSAMKVGTQNDRRDPMLFGMPMFAADVSAGPHRDRMYSVWTDYASGQGRTIFTYSTDQGHTWTKPVVLDASGPAGTVQYQAQLAVNKNGLLAITWFDTRAANDLAHYDEYFTASLDGGVTFLKPVRVSSKTSQMFGIGNMQIIPSIWRHENLARVSFTSPSTRWRSAGDYMGLAADTDGIFHPLWSDSRSGTFQIWTATVQVSTAAEPASIAPSDVRVIDMTKQVDIVTDPAHYDPSSHELEMPLRLKNLTGKPIYGPITVSVVKFGSGLGEMLRDYAPTVVNATNRKTGAGAEFDYSNALGDLHVLAPGALTGAVEWRLRIENPEKIPDMHLSITAAVIH